MLKVTYIVLLFALASASATCMRNYFPDVIIELLANSYNVSESNPLKERDPGFTHFPLFNLDCEFSCPTNNEHRNLLMTNSLSSNLRNEGLASFARLTSDNRFQVSSIEITSYHEYLRYRRASLISNDDELDLDASMAMSIINDENERELIRKLQRGNATLFVSKWTRIYYDYRLQTDLDEPKFHKWFINALRSMESNELAWFEQNVGLHYVKKAKIGKTRVIESIVEGDLTSEEKSCYHAALKRCLNMGDVRTCVARADCFANSVSNMNLRDHFNIAPQQIVLSPIYRLLTEANLARLSLNASVLRGFLKDWHLGVQAEIDSEKALINCRAGRGLTRDECLNDLCVANPPADSIYEFCGPMADRLGAGQCPHWRFKINHFCPDCTKEQALKYSIKRYYREKKKGVIITHNHVLVKRTQFKEAGGNKCQNIDRGTVYNCEGLPNNGHCLERSYCTTYHSKYNGHFFDELTQC